MEFTNHILICTLAGMAGCGWLAAGMILRRYHWRRSVERLERTAWNRTVYALRGAGQE